MLRPEAGTQAQFKKQKAPRTYAYDPSLSPALEWAGKAEHLSFDVPTLPLFVHERLSTRAIIQTLTEHKRDRQMEFQLYADPQLSLAQQLEAYEHTGGWVNRLILGDSLVVMNSLLEYEGMGSQVQAIYMDPPYGVKFGSNFQPFVRKRDVRNSDDADMTREPEMVKAYRDTWELGIHSYLTYLRDRLFVARDLLTPSGSLFVQIGNENLHLVRSLLDEVFGRENSCAVISFAKTTGSSTTLLPETSDVLLWYAKDRELVKFTQLFTAKAAGEVGATQYTMTSADGRVFTHDNLTSQTGGPTTIFDVEFEGKVFRPRKGGWKTNREGMDRLIAAGRLMAIGDSLRYVRYLDDFPAVRITDRWNDTVISGFGDPKVYVVQTMTKVIERCLLMTTEPGDLVLDPTCGSGTTAYVAEQWGRRWITVDTSRVPLALARQRILTATFPYYELRDEQRGPAGGFVYKRRQNQQGEEVGGVVPHVTLKSIANNEPSAEEIMVDRPEVTSRTTRVSGPFCVEATIPTPLEASDADADSGVSGNDSGGSFADRLIGVLQRSPVLQLGGNEGLTLSDVRRPTRTLTIAAEASLSTGGARVAVVVGPENAAVTERLVYEGAREAHARSFDRLLVIGFAIEAAARELVDKCGDLAGIPAVYVQATPDLVMGDLLKTMRSSQIFSVTGLPDVVVTPLGKEEPGGPPRWQVELRGLDVFDPVSMQVAHRSGDDVPAWLLDTDYNGMCFHVSQAFFPRTGAWDNLKKALRGEFDETVWEHLAGTTSAPFAAGEAGKVAVKVIDDRGNELLVVKDLEVADSR